MYKSDTLTRRGSLRSLRSAPLLSTVLESTLSLTRIHPIASLELPGLDYAVQSQSAIGAAFHHHHRELGTSLRSGIAAITAASASAAGGISQSQSALLGRYGPNASIRNSERKIVKPKRVLSRKLKPHLVADTVKQYISRAQRTTKKGSQDQQNNMEFLRGVYAFMQVSRSSVDYSKDSGGYEATFSELVSDANATNATQATTVREADTTATTTTTTTIAITERRTNLLSEIAELEVEVEVEDDHKEESASSPGLAPTPAQNKQSQGAAAKKQPANKSTTDS